MASKDQILRTYSSVARIEHFCDHCCQAILPGNRYLGTVMVLGGYLTVLKQHDICPPDPMGKFEEVAERDEEREKHEEELLEAA